jgi:hypothetical protein
VFSYHNSYKKSHLVAKQIALLNLFSLPFPAYARSTKGRSPSGPSALQPHIQDREGLDMTVEETHRLRRDGHVRLDDDLAGRVISCREGVLWLTQTGTPGDHLIHAGEDFSIRHPGTILVSALEDSVFAVADGKRNAFRTVRFLKPSLGSMARRIGGALKRGLFGRLPKTVA